MEKISVKGMLPLLVLYEAREGASGKGISDKAAKLTGGKWKPSPGSIYPLLRAMERKGWLTPKLASASGRREIDYFLTKKGSEAFEREKKRVLEEVENNIEMMVPIGMCLIHEFDETRLKEVQEIHERIREVRSKMLSMPIEKRRKILDKINEFCKTKID